MRAALLAGLLCFSACATPPPAPVVPVESRPSAAAPIIPRLAAEAARAQGEANRYVADSLCIPARYLIVVLTLGQQLRDAARRMRAHRTPANIATVRSALRALRAALLANDRIVPPC